MAFPLDVRTITLTGKYLDASGNGLSGLLNFTPSAALLSDMTGNVVLIGSTVAVATTGAGTFSVVLPVTDQFTPAGWTWTVTEAFTGLTSRTYSISLPSSLGASVDLSVVAP